MVAPHACHRVGNVVTQLLHRGIGTDTWPVRVPAHTTPPGELSSEEHILIPVQRQNASEAEVSMQQERMKT
eukprot:COSAG01_NODE_16590_length_1223_cov_1.058719_2_plen_71_part_00